MRYITEIGPVVLIANNDVPVWAGFFIGEDGELYVQKEEFQMQGTRVSWQHPKSFEEQYEDEAFKKFSANEQDFLISWHIYDSDYRKYYIYIWDRINKQMYLHDPEGNSFFSIGKFGKLNQINAENSVYSSLTDVAGKTSKHDIAKRKRIGLQYKLRDSGNYWQIIGKFKFISKNATEKLSQFLLGIVSDTRKIKLPDKLNKESVVNDIIDLIWARLITIKRETTSREEYKKILNYLMTADIHYLKDINSNALMVTINFYVNYKQDILSYFEKIKVDSQNINIDQFHHAVIKAIKAEADKYQSRASIKQESSARMSGIEQPHSALEVTCRRQQKDLTYRQGLVNAVTFKVAQFADKFKSCGYAVDKETMNNEIRSLSSIIENKNIWRMLPSPLRGLLYFQLRLAYFQLNSPIPENSRLSRLSKKFPLKNDWIWINRTEIALNNLRDEANSQDKGIVPFNAREFQTPQDELIWYVIFGNHKLRQRYLNDKDQVREKAKLYPSIADEIAASQELRDKYYPRDKVYELFDAACQQTHYLAAKELYKRLEVYLTFTMPSDSKMSHYTRGEYLASCHPQLFLLMIQENRSLLKQENIGKLFDLVWNKSTDKQTPELKDIFIALKNSARLKLSTKNSKYFKTADKLFCPKRSRFGFGFFSQKGSGSNTQPTTTNTTDDAPLTTYRI